MARHPELPERDRRILGAVVQAYIEQGEPVSSLWLANRGFGVSSATLRNVMARLEDLGYVRQPHTSAGRVPTDLGYRSYVDGLLSEKRSTRSTPEVEARLRFAARSVEDLMTHLSQELSRASHQVGFAIAPAAEATTLERLDFVPLDGGRVLVIVVGDRRAHLAQGDRAERRLRQHRAAAGGELPEQRVPGQSLMQVRQAVLDRLREERTLLRRAARARAAARQLAPSPSSNSEPTLLRPGCVAAARRRGGPRNRKSRSRRSESCCG